MVTDSEIPIWLFNSEARSNKLIIKQYISILSPEELAYVETITRADRRAKHILSRIILRSMLSYYTSVAVTEWVFKTLENGRPEIKLPERHKNLSFNISHSGDYIVCGFIQNGTLGIDLERHKNERNILGIAENYFTAKEYQWLNSLTESQITSAFYQLWSLKESYLKGVGVGISGTLDSISFQLPRGNEMLQQIVKMENTGQNWHFECLPCISGYSLAVAYHTVYGSPVKLIVKTINYDARSLHPSLITTDLLINPVKFIDD